MQEQPGNKPEKTQEKLFPKSGKPRGIRVMLLKTQELLMLYTRPLTVRELRGELEKEGHDPHRMLMYKMLKELAAHPAPGYQMVVKHTRNGRNKQVPAYQLLKIKRWQKTNTNTTHSGNLWGR